MIEYKCFSDSTQKPVVQRALDVRQDDARNASTLDWIVVFRDCDAERAEEMLDNAGLHGAYIA
jgi:hypothetical protein